MTISECFNTNKYINLNIDFPPIYIEEDAITHIRNATNYDIILITFIMSFLWLGQDNEDMEAFLDPNGYLADHFPTTDREIIDEVIDAETDYLREIGAIEH